MKSTNPKGHAEVPELEFPQPIPSHKQIDTRQPKSAQREETKSPDKDQQSEYKRQYIESTKRVLHHLQQVFNMPHFNEERINDLKNPQGVDKNIDISQLFSAVLDDDKQQADPCYNLQLDATLINRNFKKLDVEMKKNILKLFADNMTT